MEYLGIHYEQAFIPKLESEFIPFSVWMDAYLKNAKIPISIAIERNEGCISAFNAKIYGTEEMRDADYRFVERFMKFLLWSIGGFRIYICGCDAITKKLQEAYSATGERAFDFDCVRRLYENELEIIAGECRCTNETPKPIGGHIDGCRIGFDAGGSDRKVSAVVNGECVYSEEVVWHPKTNSDPQYHYEHIVDAFKTAASKMPRVDAIGVSSAGTYVNNFTMMASLFINVPMSSWEYVRNIYVRAAAEIGDVPLAVANDGDVTALAGAMCMDCGRIMGIAMGTSQAVGYVDKDKNVIGWLNELAFAPVDLNENAMEDEWSKDRGVGCKYFSQDAVIKLASRAGIDFGSAETPAEKLKVVQRLLENHDPRAEDVFSDIGIYLGYAIKQYCYFYDIERIMVLGRVMSGKGGDLILSICQDVLRSEYSELADRIQVMLPDEKTRRMGQSVAAASLPSIM